jgi:hypothetical protein
MRKLIALAIASLVLALSPGNASAVPISSGQTFRIDFALTPQFPGSFDVAFFGPEFSDDPLGPFESLTFKFYNSADQLLAQRTFNIGNLELPIFWTGVDFIQPTSDPTGYVLLMM